MQEQQNWFETKIIKNAGATKLQKCKSNETKIIKATNPFLASGLPKPSYKGNHPPNTTNLLIIKIGPKIKREVAATKPTTSNLMQPTS